MANSIHSLPMLALAAVSLCAGLSGCDPAESSPPNGTESDSGSDSETLINNNWLGEGKEWTVYELSFSLSCGPQLNDCPSRVDMRLYLSEARRLLCWPALAGNCEDIEVTSTESELRLEGTYSLVEPSNPWEDTHSISFQSLVLEVMTEGLRTSFTGMMQADYDGEDLWKAEVSGQGDAVRDEQAPGLTSKAAEATDDLFGLDSIFLTVDEPVFCDTLSATVTCGEEKISATVIPHCETSPGFISDTTSRLAIVPQQLWPMADCTVALAGLTDVAGNEAAPVTLAFEIPAIRSHESLGFEGDAQQNWISKDCEIADSVLFFSADAEFDVVAPEGDQMAVCNDGGKLGGFFTVPQGATQLTFAVAAGNDCLMYTESVPLRLLAVNDQGGEVLLDEYIDSIALPVGPDPQGAQHFATRTVTLPTAPASLVLQFINDSTGPENTDEGTCVAWFAIDDLRFH